MSASRRSLALLAILIGAGVLAWIPRSTWGMWHPYRPDEPAWFSLDQDGLYHARRVERALREGRVAEMDVRMSFPDGARIPWPPYYDRVLSVALRPFVPGEGAARWHWIERAVASAPRIFGVAAVLLAVLAAWRLGGAGAALVAGATVALCHGTINYSLLGTGDHHAWVSLLAGASVFVLSEALRGDALASRGKSALWGALLGLLAGLMIGSWVAALLYLLELELVLGWLIVRRAREPLPGLAALGCAFHGVALFVLLPAVMSSPWRAEFPWMVVNLSWFHLAFLGLGALVFVPLLALDRGVLVAGTKTAHFYPVIVAGALGVLALVCQALDLAPARGITEGFAWVGRGEAFMGQVQESEPLIGAGVPSGVLFLALGYGVIVLPVALAFAAWRAFAKNEHALLPWVVAVAALLPQALVQRRFADALAVPMAVVLGWGAAQVVGGKKWLVPLAAALALAAQAPSMSSAWRRMRLPEGIAGPFDNVLAEREALEWIRGRSSGDERWSVLAHWDRGHSIEWVANAPSVATNFGSYVGVESYQDPPRFFLEEDPARARAILERRQVRFVYVPARIADLVGAMCAIAAPGMRSVYLGPSGVTERWRATTGSRLLAGVPSEYLRLVHVTLRRDKRVRDPGTQQPLPAGYVWEHVAGAVIEAHGAPGEVLEVDVSLEYPAAGFSSIWQGRATTDANGLARLRVPYATTTANGDGRVTAASWRVGARQGQLVVSEQAVMSGDSVELQ